MVKKFYTFIVGFLGAAAVISHILPNFLKPKKETEIPTKALEWKK